ncbi:MAG: hypothetical protein KatS3mg111_0436 [Pirellulaceae bacterium]|nr:MAG: hypothetical protein KatS3mg111_0436 [Pirellulaceae bacterium]
MVLASTRGAFANLHGSCSIRTTIISSHRNRPRRRAPQALSLIRTPLENW